MLITVNVCPLLLQKFDISIIFSIFVITKEKDMRATDIYIRFTEDIYEDIERGYSFDFRTGEPLDGLCAWSAAMDVREYSREEIVSYCKQKAANTVKNGYGGYSSDCEVAIILADYAGSCNDGSLVKNVEVYETFNL